MTPSAPAKSPTIAIARVLRSLGLTQGKGGDFRITGRYRNGERIGTYVLTLTRHADEVVAEHADEIERLVVDETGYAFHVSVRYPGSDRPMTSVANYGDRVRETAPAPAAPAPAESAEIPAAVPEPEEAPEPAQVTAVLETARERRYQRRRATALDWSDRQAYLVATSAAGGLVFDSNGVLRDRPRPGSLGAAVDEARLGPLVKAGFLVVFEPYGPGSKRVSATVDGCRALLLWRQYRPIPPVKDRKREREPLRPLIGGVEETRIGRAMAEGDRRRKAQAESMYAALADLGEWEERDERLYKAWATVQGITHRLGRPLPKGWVPTEKEIAEHRLDPGVVAELRAEAARATPKPKVPWQRSVRPVELPPLPPAPDETEQLSLFGAEAA